MNDELPPPKRTEPVHKPKAVRFGPTIVYDAERCVMCTRCVRFCDEVAGDCLRRIHLSLRYILASASTTS